MTEKNKSFKTNIPMNNSKKITWKQILVNTQFRAYPFYKASEWMPHKKLLLNSIVF